MKPLSELRISVGNIAILETFAEKLRELNETYNSLKCNYSLRGVHFLLDDVKFQEDFTGIADRMHDIAFNKDEVDLPEVKVGGYYVEIHNGPYYNDNYRDIYHVIDSHNGGKHIDTESIRVYDRGVIQTYLKAAGGLGNSFSNATEFRRRIAAEKLKPVSEEVWNGLIDIYNKSIEVYGKL